MNPYKINTNQKKNKNNEINDLDLYCLFSNKFKFIKIEYKE